MKPISNCVFIRHIDIELKILKYKILIAFILIFIWMLWSSFAFLSYLFVNLTSKQLSNHWEYIYYTWLLLTSLIKWTTKLLGSRIDQNRIKLLYWTSKLNEHNTDNKTQISSNFNYNIRTSIISFDSVKGTKFNPIGSKFLNNKLFFPIEWILELLLSMAYFQFYRQFAVFYLLDLPVKSFIFTIFIHFLSELAQTIKFTHTYFNITSNIQEYFRNNQIFYRYI